MIQLLQRLRSAEKYWKPSALIPKRGLRPSALFRNVLFEIRARNPSSAKEFNKTTCESTAQRGMQSSALLRVRHWTVLRFQHVVFLCPIYVFSVRHGASRYTLLRGITSCACCGKTLALGQLCLDVVQNFDLPIFSLILPFRRQKEGEGKFEVRSKNRSLLGGTCELHPEQHVYSCGVNFWVTLIYFL